MSDIQFDARGRLNASLSFALVVLLLFSFAFDPESEDGVQAAMAFDGWDTHANEGGATGRLAQLLGGLDAAIAAFEKELGSRWKDTVVVAITEFGRTVHAAHGRTR